MFIDFNQANRDRTMAGAYSPRALPAGPGLDADHVGRAGRCATRGPSPCCTVPERLRGDGDPWADLLARRTASTRCWNGGSASSTNGLGELPFPPDFPEDARRAAAGAAEPQRIPKNWRTTRPAQPPRS